MALMTGSTPHRKSRRISEQAVGAVRPSAPLAAFVDHYWFSAQAGAPVTVLLPDGRVDVVLEATPAGASVAVYGSVTARTSVALQPRARYVGVQFRPGAARHFIDAAAHELTDRAVGGERALRFDPARALDAASPQSVIACLDAALRRRLARLQPVPTRIDHAIDSVARAQGQVRIDALAAHVGVSRRQIERDFLDAVELAPKAFAAILRLRHASAWVRAGHPIAEAALAAGYADQAHLSRDFQRYAGLSPTAYARGDVAFLQDRKSLPGDDDGLPSWETTPS